MNKSIIVLQCIQAPVTEKLWTTLGPEFGKNAGKTAIIIRALYGLKLTGEAFTNHVAKYMKSLGYATCKANLDLWLKAEIRPEDGAQYYS